MKIRYKVVRRFFRKSLVVVQVEDMARGKDWNTLEEWSNPYWRNATPDDLLRHPAEPG